jgi:hypothetical protein
MIAVKYKIYSEYYDSVRVKAVPYIEADDTGLDFYGVMYWMRARPGVSLQVLFNSIPNSKQKEK